MNACAIFFLSTLPAAYAQVPVSPAENRLPPQVAGWQAETDFAVQYPGNVLDIHSNLVSFSVAGTLTVKYVGIYPGKASAAVGNGPGQIFRIVAKHLNKVPSAGAGFSAETFLVLTPGVDDVFNKPLLSFEMFAGSAIPTGVDRPNSRDDGGFTYGAP